MPTAPSSPRDADDRLGFLGSVLVAALFALTSMLGTHPYRYGVGDNSITLPMLRAYVEPSLYPGDFMVAQRVYYYTYLWKGLAALHDAWGTSVHDLCLVSYALALFATMLAMIRLAMRLFGSTEVAVLSLVFLLFARPTLAGIDTVESLLNTRAVATPLTLFAMLAFLNRRPLVAYLLLGVAYLIHPLTVHPVLAMLLVTSALDRERRLQALLGLAAFGALAAPVLLWRSAQSPPSMHWSSADPRWLEALRLRSPHHMFPSTWGPEAAVHAVLVLALLVLAWRSWTPRDPGDRRVLAAWVATVCVVCVLGTVFSEIVPLGIALLLQPLRAFQFLEFLAILGVANLVVTWCRRTEPPRRFAAAVAVGCVLGYGFGDETAHTIALFLVMMCLLAWDRFAPRPLDRRAFASTVVLLAVAAAAGIAGLKSRDGDDGFSATNAQDSQWLDVQRWAQDHTRVRDAFIVPPRKDDEFRVRSMRTVYADWEDGGLMNSNPAYGIEWLRRMRRLGLVSVDTEWHFRPLTEADVRGIAAELALPGRSVFLVDSLQRGTLGFPVRYQNSRYVVAQVAPAGTIR